jgi:hypothetical protein
MTDQGHVNEFNAIRSKVSTIFMIFDIVKCVNKRARREHGHNSVEPFSHHFQPYDRVYSRDQISPKSYARVYSGNRIDDLSKIPKGISVPSVGS